MAVATRPDTTITPSPPRDTPRDTPRGRGVRIRPRSFHRGDALVLGAAATSSLALVWLVYSQVLGLSGVAGFVIWWYAAFLLTYGLAVRELRGALLARDAVMTVVIASAAAGMLVPLLMIIVFVISQGVGVITPHFFVQTSEECGQLQGFTCGGISPAIIGTVEQIALATLIAVPLAVLCAVFLNEVRGRLVRPVQLFVDAMSGVPSIVAGLFILAVWVAGLNRGFSGFAAALALSILMLPTVARTSLEVLRLVPDGLREGALALGASQWRTVWSVVLPTARSGLITAVVLGVARAVGETAPLLMTAFGSSSNNLNPFSGPQESLPHYVFYYIRFQPNTSPQARAYGAAAVLTVMVLGMFTVARLVSARMSVESRQRRARRHAE
jgi:phosphate transport system permease protein